MEEMGKKRFLFSILLPKGLQWPGLAGQSQDLGVTLGSVQRPSTWAIFHCFARHISRKVEQKCSSWGMN